MDEPRKHTESKRAINKDHMLYDCTYTKCPEQEIYRHRKWISGCHGFEEGRKEKESD